LFTENIWRKLIVSAIEKVEYTLKNQIVE